MTALLDGTRRFADRVTGLLRRRLSGERGDGGFVLLESIIAMSLITVIMAAIGVEYVGSVASVTRQRSTQSAAQLANSALEQVRALRPTDLVAGRGASSVAAQFTSGNAIPTIRPWLQKMDPVSDPNALATAGANATIPTCDPTPQGATGPTQCTQKPGAVAFTVSQFIGTCWLVTSGTSSDCLPAAQKTSSSVSYLKVVVSVSWRDGACNAGCYYVTNTLVSADPDPTFKANQPPAAAPVVNPPGNQNNDVGDAVNLQLSLVTGTGIPGFTWSLIAGTLPAGLSLNGSTGVISGVVSGPPAAQPVITVQVTDGYGRSATASFSWTVANRPVITAPPNQVSTINTPVSVQVPISCPNTPCTVTLTNPPPGLSIDPTGLITGTPTTPGTTTTTITVTDAAGVTVSSTFTWTVVSAAPTCPAPVSLPNGSFESPGGFPGAPNNVSNGTSGLAWKTSDASGQIEEWANGGNAQSANGGTPITAQDGTQWVEVNGAGMDTLYQDLATTPGQVLQWSLWHRARNATGNLDAQDSIQVQMGSTTRQTPQVPTGATAATIADGARAWVQYTGVYTVPAGQTTTRFQVAAIATSSGNVGVGNFVDNVTVTGAPCLASQPAAQNSTVGTAIPSLTLTASQGSGSFVWSGGSTLPAGLTLSPSGVITGTPTAVGRTSVSLIVTDALSGFQQTVSFSWTVFAAPTVTAPPNQAVAVGGSVNLSVSSTCANAPCTLSITALPAGLTMNAGTGSITGTTTTAGTTTSVITIRDAAGATATSAAFTWTVKAPPTITSPGNQATTVGATITLTPASTCPNTPCTFTVTSLPAGLTLNSGTGAVTGTPSTAGTTNSVITIRDAAGNTASTGTFTWTVYPAPTVTAPGNQTTSVGAGVSITVGSTCPNTPCTYTLNNAPAGLTMTGATITGSPTTAGTTVSTITIRDAAGVASTSGSFTWTIRSGPTVTAPANQVTSVGANVSVAVSSTCPNTPCTYSVTALPAGLTINSTTGTITGSPTTAGTTTSVISIRDAAGATASSAAFTWTVKAAPTVTSPGNSSIDVNMAISYALPSTCPNTPCSFALTGAPPGITINSSTGVISGAATTAGVYSAVTVTITDAAGATGSTGPMTVTVYARPTITSPGNQTDTVNTAVILPISSTCPNTPCTYALSGAPAGLTINSSTGRITGTPTATGTSTAVKVTVTDAVGVAVDTGAFTWTIAAGPSVTSPGNQSTVNNATVSLTLTTSCPNAPCAYRLNGGPAGLSISSAAVVSGTVTSAPQTFSGVTITVTDQSGATATSAAFTWTVTAPLAGRWTFDESTGTTAADSSGNAHPATLSGGYVRTTKDVQGANAVTMNGTSGTYAKTTGPILNTSSSFTVSAWVKLASTSDYSTFVAQSGTNVSGFYLQYNPSTNRFRFYKLASDATSSGGAAQSSVAAPVVGQWYQLTGVYDSTAGTISLFVNGVRQGAPAAAPGGFNATGSFTFGAGNFGGLTNWLNGSLDDVRAFSSALSDDAVAQLAQAGYWTFDDGSGTTATDSSLNNNDGTLSGGVTWTTPIVGSSALQFNGSTGLVTSGNVLDTGQSYSVTAWAKADSASSTGAVVSVDGTNISSFILRQDSNHWLLVGVTNDSTSPSAVVNVSSTSTLVTGQWYQLTGVYDSAAHTLALYVNGVLQGSPVPFTSSFPSTGALLIGRSRYGSGSGGLTNYFNGAIDDVHAFRFPLDQAGVTTLTTLTPPTPATPTASAGSSSATVSWSAPSNVGGSPVTGYVVTPYLNGVAQAPVSFSSTATSQTITGLTTGDSYTFSVAASNANGTSPASAVSSSVVVS